MLCYAMLYYTIINKAQILEGGKLFDKLRNIPTWFKAV